MLAGLGIGPSSGCRIERVDPEDRSQLNARGLMTRTEPEKPPLPVALAGFGLSERELEQLEVTV